MPGDSKQSQTRNLLIFFHFLVFLNSVFSPLSHSLLCCVVLCVCCGRFRQLGGDPEWARRREGEGKKRRDISSDSDSSDDEEGGILQRTGKFSQAVYTHMIIHLM